MVNPQKYLWSWKLQDEILFNCTDIYKIEILEVKYSVYVSRPSHYLEINKKNFFGSQHNVTKKDEVKNLDIATKICNAKVTSNRTITE